MKKIIKVIMITAISFAAVGIAVIALALILPSISRNECDNLQKNTALHNHSYNLAISKAKLCDLEYKNKYSFPLKEWESAKIFIEKFGPAPVRYETISGESYTSALNNFIQSYVKYPDTVERRSCGIPSMSTGGWLYGCSFYSKNSFNLSIKTHRFFQVNKTTYKVLDP